MILIKLFDLQGNGLGYLKSYDPDVGDDTITGDVVATFDIGDALKFANMLEAMECAMQQSKRVPLRPDGEPNCPLTAFTIEFKKIDT